MVSWVGFSAFTAVVRVQSLVWELRPRIKLLYAAAKKQVKIYHSKEKR